MRFCFLFVFFFCSPFLLHAETNSYEDKVVVIQVGEKDLMNAQSFKFWRRTLERVNEQKAKAVIFQLDTPGGLAIQTKDIMVNELRDLEVPSYAFVDDEAISAGALISVATDEIWMTPGSTIGAAAIVDGSGVEIGETMRAKLESFFEANVRAVTQDKGHSIEIVKMMMFINDENREYGPISVEKGSLLTLTAEEAVLEFKGKPVLAQGIVQDRAELIQTLGFNLEDVVEAGQTGFEKLAWYVAAFSPVLILIGMGGAYVELKTPGFGLGGSVALIAFGVFFFGNYVAGNLAGFELVAIFLFGILFIVIELFVFPSLFLGLIGAVMVIGALLFAMVDKLDLKDIGQKDFFTREEFSWLDALSTPMWMLSAGLIGGLFFIFLLMKLLPHIPLPGFVLKREIGEGSSEIYTNSQVEEVGLEGVALMDLRPVGKVQIASKNYDVITRGEFIPKGERVRIIAKEQMRTVVERV